MCVCIEREREREREAYKADLTSKGLVMNKDRLGLWHINWSCSSEAEFLLKKTSVLFLKVFNQLIHAHLDYLEWSPLLKVTDYGS